jgi:hypothetical protein
MPPFCLEGLDGCELEPVGAVEARWMSAQRELALDLCDGAADSQTLAQVLTRVHHAWERQPCRPDPTLLTAMFGLAVGDLLVRRAPGLGWVLMTDGRTAELALTHAHAELAVFPLSAVAQRWSVDCDGDWLLPYVEQVVIAVRGALDTPT